MRSMINIEWLGMGGIIYLDGEMVMNEIVMIEIEMVMIEIEIGGIERGSIVVVVIIY